MVQYYDHIPDNLAEWINKQHMFWTASAPLNPTGHVNLSPKSMPGSFQILNQNKVFYEDITGSGIETISHLRENGRITIMFNAFEGPPRILRIFGTGHVHEYGSLEYDELIPPETRKPGSRAAIVVDVYQVTTSCGYAVPNYKFESHRDQLTRWCDSLELFDRKSVEEGSTEINSKGLKAYWIKNNLQSLDGVPGLHSAHENQRVPWSLYDRNAQPKEVEDGQANEGANGRANGHVVIATVAFFSGMLGMFE
ncbi:hypothetical protein SERLADRAFT_467802 [Serpula lacrymans var. lacrymans S7.9]|uniref:Uncharacterized protein n=1 Tax=Serpula lacrymans var. lacrymans (strain S7.9) TaxID=578457 RepID=F8NWY0_SERL9|nr:uncharacterized protein SERLADRAFT_467802 [Serpula lacrymans var. lacrymans S7.9]EGO24455.1 hypothetical protein SERLADRAFT_467802 [Serpula lacrymans var. lacrymans S7.9]